MKEFILIILLILNMIQLTNAQDNDPHMWLEEVEDPKALEWVEDWNQKSLQKLTSAPVYKKMYEQNLEIYNSTDRIAEPSIYGNYIYNFWQDQEHVRGIWRRTTLESYVSKNPEWEILLDLDKLSEAENIKWVFKGVSGLYPLYNRFLVNLSKGGGDAIIIKEFDAETKSFVENGFAVPEAKSSASWIDINTLMVSSDFGDGITTSGYPKQVKIWKRGTNLENAQLIFNGKENDMGVWGYAIHEHDKVYQIISQRSSFYTGSLFFIENGKQIKPDLPEDIDLNAVFKEQVIFQLKSDWNVDGKNYPQGAVISIPYNDLIENRMNIKLVVEPGERSSVTEITTTRNKLLLNMLSNVKSELYACSFNGDWKRERISAPDFGNLGLAAASDFNDNYFFYFQNFLEPSTLFLGDAGTGKIKKVRALKSYFPTEKYKVQQLEAISKDGTRIPYFVVSSKNLVLNGNNPTLLYAYGGFEVPMLPKYSAITGTSWLEQGGVYVVANLRGGGEFGPKWHQAVLKENRQKVFDDFHAVAENLISNKITSPQKLGIYGGSNGGLLVGVAFTQRPDLYNAVVCAVPLLDMKRYNKLLAGASWMAEYGNPDLPEEWEYISRYSPYQNVERNKNYPEVFFTTSTRDDRVHPGHARKMVARMNELGYNIYYFENTEGGHAGASTNEQRAMVSALIYSYLHMKLIKPAS